MLFALGAILKVLNSKGQTRRLMVVFTEDCAGHGRQPV